VFEDIINDAESDSLVRDIWKRMKRKRWEKGHWDAVISYYKETELEICSGSNTNQIQALSPSSVRAIERIRNQIFRSRFAEHQNISWLPVHAIHLHKDGILSAHVDSVKFSGTVVCGLSLLSDCIMRLRPACPNESPDSSDHDNITSSEHVNGLGNDYVDLFLPPRSLYILSGASRYRYTHEILPSGARFRISYQNDIIVNRNDRLSLIFRDSKDKES
jgi:alkylated DNA repair protein alkB family protein 7